MKKQLKKILTTTLVSAATIAAVGCGSPNTKLANNIDKGMAEFVSSINNLDYVETAATETNADNKIGKIVETAANALDDQYLTQTLEELNIENSITHPSERSDNFKLYVLSASPFISFTSDDNTASINMQLNFSTNKIEEASTEINEKVNNLILKRSILMIYVNEIYNNRVELSEENRIAINAYVNVIKENASFLNGNRGMVKNQLTLANDLASNNSNNNLINYYIIKSGEALETRSSKIDSTISAIDSIIDIIENNLTPASIYYSSSLSTTYDDLISNISNSNNTISNTENKELADNISASLKFSTLNAENEAIATLPEFRIANQRNTSASNSQNELNKQNTATNSKQINKSTDNQTTRSITNNSQTTTSNQRKTLTKNNSANQKNNLNKDIIYNNNSAAKSRTLEMHNNKKSANVHRKTIKNNEIASNNHNFAKQELENNPKTLEIPHANIEENIENKSQYKTNINNQNNQNTKQSSTTNSSITKKRTPNNTSRNHTHENIKRVPYVKNYD